MKVSIILTLLLLSGTVFALELPKGLQTANEQTIADAQKITFFIAFIGGMLSFLSPCILPTLPAFFSYTFKERKKITKMTLAFFLGFSLVFVIMGLAASYLGIYLTTLQENMNIIIIVSGIALVFFGVLAIFGKGFSSFIKIRKKPRYDFLGIFLFGSAFALGWSACVGPIIAGVLIAGSTMPPFWAGSLLFIYSLGIFVPLFIVSFFYDKYDLGRFLTGREFSIAGRKFHTTSFISGSLLIFLGMLFIFSGNTSIFNTADFLGTKGLFYETQRALKNIGSIDILGFVLLLAFAAVLFWSLRMRKETRRSVNEK